MTPKNLRNIAIIAHVDHGKTTLVDKLLQQTDTLSGQVTERVMDSNELEKERGITIHAKTTAIKWGEYRINIVDTPGHADFGGEVERILAMVDSVLLLVDAVDGPMPQTRFVTQKAFAQKLNPIVVINKIDRPNARPDWVIDQVFDLFDRLGATDKQLDFPILYTSALDGYAKRELTDESQDMTPLLETIIEKVSPPDVDLDAPFQMQVTSLDYSSYIGAIGIGRITRGQIKPNTPIVVMDRDGNQSKGRILQVFSHLGLERVEVSEASAGDIVAVAGIEGIRISDTLCDPEAPEMLPPLTVTEPTVTMTFQVNDSPLAGREGKHVTSRKLAERLERELIHNVALAVSETEDADKFRVSGRGELHLSILIETMRREGYELAVSRPEAITKVIDGEECEPFENLILDIEQQHQGDVMERISKRMGQLMAMTPDQAGRIRLDYVIPSRGLIGFHTEFMTATSGTGLMHSNFDRFGPKIKSEIGARENGVLIANSAGKASAFALWNLQARGRMVISPQTEVYEGMIIGIHTRDNDLVVNVIKGKQLTNIRAASADEKITLIPPVKMGLEQALEFINFDELVEVTPQSIRLRKKGLKEHERKRGKK